MGLTVRDLVPPTRGVTRWWSLRLAPEERGEPTKTGASTTRSQWTASGSRGSGRPSAPTAGANGPTRPSGASRTRRSSRSSRKRAVPSRCRSGSCRTSCGTQDRRSTGLEIAGLRRRSRSGDGGGRPSRSPGTKTCADGGPVPRDAHGSAGQVPRRRGSYRGHRVARPARGARPHPELKGRYYADLFSGTGGVGRAVARAGFVGRCWERADGRSGDLGDPQTLARLLRDIRDGKVLGASLSPPCGSFSIARDRTMKVRSRRCPWG